VVIDQTVFGCVVVGLEEQVEIGTPGPHDTPATGLELQIVMVMCQWVEVMVALDTTTDADLTPGTAEVPDVRSKGAVGLHGTK